VEGSGVIDSGSGDGVIEIAEVDAFIQVADAGVPAACMRVDAFVTLLANS
jgi:hypothetical protein